MTNDITRDEVVENTEMPTNFDDVLAADAVGNEELDTQDFDDRVKEDFSFQITCDRKLTQEIADLIGIDLNNPLKDDPYMGRNPYGRQQYFGCFVPDGYFITQKGVWKMNLIKAQGGEIKEAPVRICPTRMMQTGLYTSVEGNITELTFIDYNNNIEVIRVPISALQTNDAWKTYTKTHKGNYPDIIQKQFADVQEFLQETRVTNNNEGGTAFKKGECHTRTGWTDKNHNKFALNYEVWVNNYGELKENDVIFTDIHHTEPDMRLTPRGTLQGWKHAILIENLIAQPIVRFKMYYDTASLFLSYLGVPNSGFGMSGDTSTGKTFTMQCSTSMFGNPTAEGTSLILNGDISLAAINAIFTTLKDLPKQIDEITAMKEKTREGLMYGIGNGKESMRSTSDGDVRSSKEIRCNVSFTGEIKVTSKTSNDGENARLFTLKDKPLPYIDPDNIDEIRKGICENYGHVLKLIIAQFFKDKNEMIIWYKDAVTRLRKTTNDNIIGRKASYFAAAEASGILLERVFSKIGIEPMNPQDITDNMWKDCVLSDPDISVYVNMLDDIEDIFNSNTSYVVDSYEKTINGYKETQPPRNQQKIWFNVVRDKDNTVTAIDINPDELTKMLLQKGYKPGQVERAPEYWRNNDYSECTVDNTNGKLMTSGIHAGEKLLLKYKAYHYTKYTDKKPKQSPYIRFIVKENGPFSGYNKEPEGEQTFISRSEYDPKYAQDEADYKEAFPE